MIAFCEARGWQRELTLHYLMGEDSYPGGRVLGARPEIR